MALDWLMNMVATALDGFVSRLPAFSTASWPVASSISTLAGYIALMWNLFPGLSTALQILAAGVAVEVALLAWYWINWFIKKIPGIG